MLSWCQLTPVGSADTPTWATIRIENRLRNQTTSTPRARVQVVMWTQIPVSCQKTATLDAQASTRVRAPISKDRIGAASPPW